MNDFRDHPLALLAADGLPTRQALAAELLRRVMLQYSEDFFCASWLHNMEFSLWAMIHPECGLKDQDRTPGPEFITLLRSLSDLADGWWMWSDQAGGEVFVPLGEWKNVIEERKNTGLLSGPDLTGFLKGKDQMEFEREQDREL